ncbi:hypothetical protein cand_013810 [Cryptosporidium andersoni]|uniref:F-box domain-containing protein n=1 Tax=Cryptosporidium andersoni TaxID=117008 RepID=A0A1J4MY10_9CRYT|nr:hypothetical protein cand_013810 [Cryptosporidium andersoni]
MATAVYSKSKIIEESLQSEDLVGLIASFIPCNEIHCNLSKVNKLWTRAINNSYECWTDIHFSDKDIEDNLLKPVISRAKWIKNVRISNPTNNVTGFLTRLVTNKQNVGNCNNSIIWTSLNSIEIYNRSVIVPSELPKLPVKSLFHLGITDGIYEILQNTSKVYNNSNKYTNHPLQSVTRLIIDYPISTKELKLLKGCFPAIRDLVITRLFHSKSDTVPNYQLSNNNSIEGYYPFDDIGQCWEAIYDFLQIINPNQLRILQISIIPSPHPLSGKWVVDHRIKELCNQATYNSLSEDKVELSSNNIKRIRIQEYNYYNNPINEIDEKGDKLIKFLLDNHSESLIALTCPDLEVSHFLYKRLIKDCQKLQQWDLPGWRAIAALTPLREFNN